MMVAHTIVDSLQSDSADAEAERQKRITATQQHMRRFVLAWIQMYEDKLDDKANEEFWTRKTNEWRGARIASSESARALESKGSRSLRKTR